MERAGNHSFQINSFASIVVHGQMSLPLVPLQHQAAPIRPPSARCTAASAARRSAAATPLAGAVARRLSLRETPSAPEGATMSLLLAGFHLTHQRGRATSTNSQRPAADLLASRHPGHLITGIQRETIHQMIRRRSQLAYRQSQHNHAPTGRPAPERRPLFPMPRFLHADRAGR